MFYEEWEVVLENQVAGERGMLSENELEDYDKQVSANADALIQKGYKQWRKERRQLKKDKRYVTQEDRIREIEEEVLLEQRKT